MDEAIEVLRLALSRSDQGPQTGPDVRLALKALRFSGNPAEAVKQFSDDVAGDHESASTVNGCGALPDESGKLQVTRNQAVSK